MAKEVIVAGNFKANTVAANAWLNEFSKHISSEKLTATGGKIVVCPSFAQLHEWREALAAHTYVSFGAQDVSSFEPGAHTGEVTAEMLKAAGVQYVIIGHSERRAGLGETDQLLAQKVARATSLGLEVIYCVPNAETPIPQGISIVAYEPPTAIGSGNPDTPENADSQAALILKQSGIRRVLYGGSVKPENVATFVSQPSIGGVLIGGASLKGEIFGQLAQNAITSQ
jgi:triosephosphate isomerase